MDLPQAGGQVVILENWEHSKNPRKIQKIFFFENVNREQNVKVDEYTKKIKTDTH